MRKSASHTLTLGQKTNAMLPMETTTVIMESIPEVILKPELRRRLGKSDQTVTAWMEQGAIPFVKIHNSVFFVWQDVVEGLKQYSTQNKD